MPCSYGETLRGYNKESPNLFTRLVYNMYVSQLSDKHCRTCLQAWYMLKDEKVERLVVEEFLDKHFADEHKVSQLVAWE